MKQIITLILIAFSFTACAQTQTSPPSGSVTYGNTTFLGPDGKLWFGTNSLQYRSVYNTTQVNAFIAAIPIFDASLYYTKTASDARFVSLTGSYVNPSFIVSLPYSKITGAPGALTFGNGLRSQSGVVKLGLDLSTIGTTNLGVLTEPTFLLLQSTNQLASTSLVFNNTSTTTAAALTVSDNSNQAGIQMASNPGSSSAVIISDDILLKGATYFNDYSTVGKSDDRWIPDWGAVKSIIPSVTGFELLANKQNSLATDGTNIKYPTVTAVNTGLALKGNLANGNTWTGAQNFRSVAAGAYDLIRINNFFDGDGSTFGTLNLGRANTDGTGDYFSNRLTSNYGISGNWSNQMPDRDGVLATVDQLPTSANFIENRSTASQTGNFWLNGIGRASSFVSDDFYGIAGNTAGRLQFSTGSGTIINRNSSDNISVFTVNNIHASGTGAIQTWQAAGVEQARMTTGGYMYTNAVNLVQVPGTSASTYDILTRNTSTGLVEKIPSSTLGNFELKANKQNSLAADGTGVKFPTVDAINTLNSTLIHTTGNETKTGAFQVIGEFSQLSSGKQVVIDGGVVTTNDLTTSGVASLDGTGAVILGVTTPHTGSIKPPTGGFSVERVQTMQDATGVIALISDIPSLSSYETLSNKSTSTSLGTSNTLYPTQNAVKSYVDGLDAGNVKISGSQTITGSKLFSAATQFTGGLLSGVGSGSNFQITNTSVSVANTTTGGTASLESDGSIQISANNGDKKAELRSTNVLGIKLFEFPNASGTLALTSDIPTNITPNSLTLTGQTTPTYTQGRLVYDTTNESLTFFNNDANVSLQIGQENWVRVVNNTGSTIANGAAVYVNGSSAGMPTVALAQSNAGATTVGLGLATEAIPNGATGYITSLGLVRGLNTSAFAIGAVYIDPNTPGALTQTVPTAGNYRYRVGFVTSVNATTGTIHVTPTTAVRDNIIVTQSINFASTAANANSTVTVSVTGAALGDSVALGIPNASIVSTNHNYQAWVSAANTVSVRFNNNSPTVAADPAVGDFVVRVVK